MAANGSRVTQKQLFETINSLDTKLSTKVDAVLAAVNENRVANAGEFACLQAGLKAFKEDTKGDIDRHEDEIKDIRNRTNLWGGFNTVLAVVAGLVGLARK